MSIGMSGILLTALGTALAVLGYFYFDWLMIPGGLVALVGAALLSDTREQVLSGTRHTISDSYENGVQKDPGHAESDEK